ncbi:hypothetical protein EYZ11_012366 [Aspergillus tanneri]|uniref:Uncharacterized protein n=1 Tax=Aspergillus tanneri TaxID=1220188 RepID=A0A4S3J0P4_9EURO|nr:hypothetical protein EYZ11_012366 [Aspergillus tanneri]
MSVALSNDGRDDLPSLCGN